MNLQGNPGTEESDLSVEASYAAITKAPSPIGLIQQKFISHSYNISKNESTVSLSQADGAAPIRNTANHCGRRDKGVRSCYWLLKYLPESKAHHFLFHSNWSKKVTWSTPQGQ